MRSLLPVLLGVGMLLAGCDRKRTVGETSSREAEATKSFEGSQGSPPPPAKPPWYKQLDAGELVQSGREITDKYVREADKALDNLNVEDLKSRAEGLGKAMRVGDFTEAQILADKMGKSLDSGSIGACVNFFKISSEKGSEAAREEIRKYMDSVKLSPEEKKVFQELHANIATMNAEERINLVTIVAVFACEAKLGHGGGAIGVLLGNALKIAFQVDGKTRNQEKAIKPSPATAD